jgi:hypothetical protein
MDGGALAGRVIELVGRDHEDIRDDDVNRLALDLFAWQRGRCVAVARIADAFLGDHEPAEIDEIPAVPTDVFKTTRVACFPPEETTHVFRTSGTTRDVRGEHHFANRVAYRRAALSAASRWLLTEPTYRFILLALDEDEAPDSSLSFMLGLFARRWSPTYGHPFYIRDGAVDLERLVRDLERAERDGVPVAMLGASYGFVHLFEGAPEGRFKLPPESVVMPTGGYKGRSREMDAAEFHAELTARLGVPRGRILGEYGMTELSSQAYEALREGAPPGVYRAPPWMRVTAVDPVTLRAVREGEVGLLRVVDLANHQSAIAVQTSDLGRVRDGGFEVLGRAPGATPRGCARALDAVLRGEG